VTAPSTNSYIAIVDDDAAIRSASGRALRMEDYDVELFEDGLSALKAIQLRAPDAIVLDLQLPDIDGLEICRRIRRSGDTTPILMLTARDAVNDAWPVSTWAPTDYLVKPLTWPSCWRGCARCCAVTTSSGRWCGTALRGPFTESPDPRSYRGRGRRTHEDRVRPAGVVFTSPTTGAHARSDPRPRLGYNFDSGTNSLAATSVIFAASSKRRTKCD